MGFSGTDQYARRSMILIDKMLEKRSIWRDPKSADACRQLPAGREAGVFLSSYLPCATATCNDPARSHSPIDPFDKTGWKQVAVSIWGFYSFDVGISFYGNEITQQRDL